MDIQFIINIYLFLHVLVSAAGIAQLLVHREDWTPAFSKQAHKPWFWVLTFAIYPWLMIKRALPH